jgi:hypothetical protein
LSSRANDPEGILSVDSMVFVKKAKPKILIFIMGTKKDFGAGQLILL